MACLEAVVASLAEWVRASVTALARAVKALVAELDQVPAG